jgi:putative ABC transport system permease protein
MKVSFKKIARDLLSNKSRSAIVLIAIILGAFGVSMMTTAYNLLGKNLQDNYLKTNPASFTIVVENIADSTINRLKQLPEIENIETRNRIIGRVEVVPNEFVPIWLFVVDDFKNLNINTFRLLAGQFPTSSNEILVERTGNRLLDISLQKTYPVTIPGIEKQTMKISGIVHDPAQAPSWMEGLIYGYIQRDCAVKMGFRSGNQELKFTIRNNKYDWTKIEEQLAKTTQFLTLNKIKITRTEILPPGKHIHQSQMNSLMFLLQMFGVLALVLSCFLIINMIMAIMAKETRQIGVMKAIGASAGKITFIYLSIVFAFGFVATLVALPIGYLSGKGYAMFVASMLNFELFNLQISHGVILFQIAIGTLLPVLVSIVPVYRASQITVREALNDYGVKDTVSLTSNHSKRFAIHWRLSNTTMFAIRNTFRRKGRLVLTLVTLVLGGAIFISAFNIRTSLQETVKSRFTNQHYDLSVYFAENVDKQSFIESLDSLPIISGVETWNYAKTTLITPGHSESELIELKAPQASSAFFVPEMMAGQWLSGNSNEVVVNHVFLAKYPKVKLGDSITLKLKGKLKTLRVTGCIRELFSTATVYINQSQFEDWKSEKGVMTSALIAFNISKYPDLSSNSAQLEQWFQKKELPVSLVFRKDQYKDRVIDHLVVITTMLIMITFLLILVGGLGLITTMSINIIERIRELSVLRSIGVTSKNLYWITVIEGFVIGLISWAISLILSIPVSYYLGNKFFTIFFETTLNFNMSVTGIIIWLFIIVTFSAVAVIVPTMNAARQTVSAGLAYE